MSSKDPKSIFIMGTAKTGTTLLYYSLKSSAERIFGPYKGVFEPRTEADIRGSFSHPCVVKMLMERFNRCSDKGFIDHFGTRILIVRDPRDTIVSRMLYQMRDFFTEDSGPKVQSIVDLIQSKERDPSSVSVSELYSEIGRIMGFSFSWEMAAENALSTINADGLDGFYTMRYEDMIDGRWDGLSTHVGFPVTPAEVKGSHQRVRRGMAYGDWNKWFTDSDVQLFKPVLAASMKRAGYLDDWELASKPYIDPASGSEYVERLFKLKLEAINSKQ
ncbi:hypothetical protein [Maricaulis parjimensis]|uniref:hypothetical protein n=1 Tax=Maricaulis parjimensis TaxID=144023 RepID=UPI00193A5524|nr:hypothetical protein [Maricaulis parjimensis]